METQYSGPVYEAPCEDEIDSLYPELRRRDEEVIYATTLINEDGSQGPVVEVFGPIKDEDLPSYRMTFKIRVNGIEKKVLVHRTDFSGATLQVNFGWMGTFQLGQDFSEAERKALFPVFKAIAEMAPLYFKIVYTRGVVKTLLGLERLKERMSVHKALSAECHA